MSRRHPVIGITLGDINGIGPEIALDAAHQLASPSQRLALVGDAALLDTLCKTRGIPPLPRWEEGRAYPRNVQLACMNVPCPRVTLQRTPGKTTVQAARAAYHWIVRAADMALSGDLDAIVTAPIQKEGFLRAGLNVPGHTELLAQCANVRQVEMMLLNDHFRVVLCTRHIPIREVASQLTVERIRETIRYTETALAWLGIHKRRIAVCALNPHAGDGGAIGDEEIRILRPALRAFRSSRAHITGPVPADTVFYQVRQGAYDAVVAMYHDQGLAPFKMIAFEDGINLTLGLPFVRTSPDHGTAYDLAGTGRANSSSMKCAILLAAKLARRPNPWRAS